MGVARHPLPKELVGVPIEEIMNRYVARFRDRRPDWAAFEDAKIEGYKRAQHRFIGAGGSGKHGDPTVIPAGNFWTYSWRTSLASASPRASAPGSASPVRPASFTATRTTVSSLSISRSCS